MRLLLQETGGASVMDTAFEEVFHPNPQGFVDCSELRRVFCMDLDPRHIGSERGTGSLSEAEFEELCHDISLQYLPPGADEVGLEHQASTQSFHLEALHSIDAHAGARLVKRIRLADLRKHPAFADSVIGDFHMPRAHALPTHRSQPSAKAEASPLSGSYETPLCSSGAAEANAGGDNTPSWDS